MTKTPSGKQIPAWLVAVAAAVLIVAWGLLFAGCRTAKPAPVSPANSAILAPVDAQAEAARVAADEAARAQAERDSRLAASTEVIGRQNEQAPVSPQRPVIAAEVGLLQRILSAAPSPVDRAEAAERESLLLSGKLSEAAKHYTDASTRADALNAQIAASNAREADALALVKSTIATAAQELSKQQAQHVADMAAIKAQHQRELDEARSEVLRDQVAKLNYAGAACEAAAVALIGLGFFFGGLAALRKMAPIAAFLGIAGMLAFGLAQIVGQWWFKWACLSAVVIVAVWVGVFLYRHYRAGDLAKELATRSDKLTAVVKDVIPALDHVYDGGTETLDQLKERGIKTVRDLLDSDLFSKLSATMDKATKATVHEIRAETTIPVK